ncbi:hypothetical protein BDR22DRAFT_838949 [Usnea florida]
MTAQRAWGWDIHEMRDAARIDNQMLDEFSDAPIISGFISVNKPASSGAAPTCPEHDHAPPDSKTVGKPRATKRRKTQPPAPPKKNKPKKVASSKKVNRAKTTVQADYHDTSQKNVLIEGTPPTPGKSEQVEVELKYNDLSCGQDLTLERQTGPRVDVQLSLDGTLKSDSSITVRDFGVPPFTQTSPLDRQVWNAQETKLTDVFDPLDSASGNHFKDDDTKGGEHSWGDEFPMDDECLEEMMQSMLDPAEEGLVGSNWQPQNLSDNTFLDDGQLLDDKSHWPGAIPDLGDRILHDEDRTSMASNTVDFRSSPELSSQTSCVLSHVTGNANPDRVRTSEGAENCSDDYDVDDGLTDLMVDESQHLQVTSETPTKRPSSPKLQWLPPKNYTPAKSSQIPVSSHHDPPQLLHEDSNGDIPPFVRPPFPKPVRDRSPILGLTNRTVLRICFRIGEGLNAAAVASRTNVDAIVELYARIVSSSREASGGYKQHFQFGDLFTDKPPYLNGLYTLWKGVSLWDNDSKQLDGEQGRGKMVRVLGRIKNKEPRHEQGPAVEMIVLSIWEVDWEDIRVAKGIACS